MCRKAFEIDFDGLAHICESLKPCGALRDTTRERGNLYYEDPIFILFNDDTVFHTVYL